MIHALGKIKQNKETGQGKRNQSCLKSGSRLQFKWDDSYTSKSEGDMKLILPTSSRNLQKVKELVIQIL